MEPSELLTPEVKIPKPIGKLNIAPTFSVSTAVKYRPSVVFLSDLFEPEQTKKSDTVETNLDDLEETEETVEDDFNDVEEESEDILKDLLEEATSIGAFSTPQKRQRTPQKRFDPNQQLRESVSAFKRQKRAQLEQEMKAKSGNASLSENEEVEIKKQLQVATAAFLKQQDGNGDLDWYLKNIVQQPVKDEFYFSALELLAFVDSQAYPSDAALLEAMILDADSLDFLGISNEVLSATPVRALDTNCGSDPPVFTFLTLLKTKKEQSDMEKRSLKVEAIKSLFTEVIFPEYTSRGLRCLAATPEGLLLSPSQWNSLQDNLDSSRKALQRLIDVGREEDSVDSLAYQATLEVALQEFIYALSMTHYARILGFWREKQTICSYLAHRLSASAAESATPTKKDVQKTEEYHLLNIALDSFDFFEDLLRDYLETVDNFAVDMFELDEEDRDDDDNDDDDAAPYQRGFTFLPPFPGEEEAEEDDEDEEDEEREEDEEGEDDEEDEEDSEEAEDHEEEETDSPFETPKKGGSSRVTSNKASTSRASSVPSTVDPVDAHAPEDCKKSFHVYVDRDGVPYSVLLNMSDIAQTRIKFYAIQILENDSASSWAVFCRWGRGDEVGQSSLSSHSSETSALKMFEKKFFEKTQNRWSSDIFSTFKGHPAKYMLITKSAAVATPMTSSFDAPKPSKPFLQRAEAQDSNLDKFVPENVRVGGAKLLSEPGPGGNFEWNVDLVRVSGQLVQIVKIQLVAQGDEKFGLYQRIGKCSFVLRLSSLQDSVLNSNRFPLVGEQGHITYTVFDNMQVAKDTFCVTFNQRTGHEWNREASINGINIIPGKYGMILSRSSISNSDNSSSSSTSSAASARLADSHIPASFSGDSPAHIYHDENGLYWDAVLNQTKIATNTNNFFILQLIAGSSGNYAVFCRWGRVGQVGMTKLETFTSLETAKTEFQDRFQDKTGSDWFAVKSGREQAKGPYIPLEMGFPMAAPASSKQSNASPQLWFQPNTGADTGSGTHASLKDVEKVWNEAPSPTKAAAESPQTSSKTRKTPSNGSASKKRLSENASSLFSPIISFRTLNVFSQALQKCTMPPSSHVFNAIVEGDVRIAILEGHTNSEAAVLQLNEYGLEALEVISASGSKNLVVYRAPRLVTSLANQIDDEDPEQSTDDHFNSRSNGDDSPSLHEIKIVIDTLRLLSKQSALTEQQMFDSRLAIAKVLFGDATRALLHVLLKFHIPAEVPSPSSTNLLVQGQPGAIHLPAITTVLGQSVTGSGPVDLITAIVSFYGRVYHWSDRAEEWKKDKSLKHSRQATVSKTEYVRCSKKYGPSSSAILSSLAQFVAYPAL